MLNSTGTISSLRRAVIVAAVLMLFVSWSTKVYSNNKNYVRIVLAGDSTVTDKSGWGLGFAGWYGKRTKVINLSLGGRSSKSFRDEGVWQKVLDAKPDYVLIQFGHNDQPGKGPLRETDPETTYRANMNRYVDEIIAQGGRPVLVTPISRRTWGKAEK